MVYKPVAANGFHETLVYTAKDGHQEFASAFASNTSPPGSSAADLVKAASAAHDHVASPYGVLKTETGSAANPGLFGPPGAKLQTETVATGTHLETQWAKIKEAYREVDAAHFTYSPLTQNSRASIAMVAAGIQPPTDNNILGRHWTPASDNILPIPVVTHGSHGAASAALEPREGAGGRLRAETAAAAPASPSEQETEHAQANARALSSEAIRGVWRRSVGLPSQAAAPGEGQFASQVQAPTRARGLGT